MLYPLSYGASTVNLLRYQPFLSHRRMRCNRVQTSIVAQLLSNLMPGAQDMQRKQLTDANIAALAAKRKRYVVYDSEVRSLGVRVSPRGLKTFVVVKRINLEAAIG